MLKAEFLTTRNSSTGYGHECDADLNKKRLERHYFITVEMTVLVYYAVTAEIRTLVNLSEDTSMPFISSAEKNPTYLHSDGAQI